MMWCCSKCCTHCTSPCCSWGTLTSCLRRAPAEQPGDINICVQQQPRPANSSAEELSSYVYMGPESNGQQDRDAVDTVTDPKTPTDQAEAANNEEDYQDALEEVITHSAETLESPVNAASENVSQTVPHQGVMKKREETHSMIASREELHRAIHRRTLKREVDCHQATWTLPTEIRNETLHFLRQENVGEQDLVEQMDEEAELKRQAEIEDVPENLEHHQAELARALQKRRAAIYGPQTVNAWKESCRRKREKRRYEKEPKRQDKVNFKEFTETTAEPMKGMEGKEVMEEVEKAVKESLV